VAGAVKRLKEGESVAKVNEWLKVQTPEAGKAGFYILASQDKETGQAVPAMVAVVGGEYGLDEEHFQAVLQAAKRLEEVDPGFLEETANQSGARFISARSSFMSFGPKDKDTRGGSNDGHDMIHINNNNEDTSPINTQFIFLVERFEIKAQRKFSDSMYIVGAMSVDEIRDLKTLAPEYFGNAPILVDSSGNVILNFGAYAMIKVVQWVIDNDSHLTSKEVDHILGSASYNYNHYIKDRLMKHLKDNGIPFSVVQ